MQRTEQKTTDGFFYTICEWIVIKKKNRAYRKTTSPISKCLWKFCFSLPHCLLPIHLWTEKKNTNIWADREVKRKQWLIPTNDMGHTILLIESKLCASTHAWPDPSVSFSIRPTIRALSRSSPNACVRRACASMEKMLSARGQKTWHSRNKQNCNC